MSKITNEQKYKTAEERVKAFDAWCRKEEQCKKCGLDTSRACAYCFNRWLALEADEEKPEPCPFCGKSCTAHKGIDMIRPHVSCDDEWCGYKSAEEPTIAEAIAAHNRVARAVMASKKK